MARLYKAFAEKVKGHVLQAVIDNPDSEGFGPVKEWQVCKDGKVIHTNKTNMKARRWIIQNQPAPVVVPSP